MDSKNMMIGFIIIIIIAIWIMPFSMSLPTYIFGGIEKMLQEDTHNIEHNKYIGSTDNLDYGIFKFNPNRLIISYDQYGNSLESTVKL